MDSIGRNITQSAALYSQLAGVLAGLVFVAIIPLLTTPPRGRAVREISVPLYALAVASIGMLDSSALFGELASEIVYPNRPNLRIYVISLLVTSVFVLTILQLVVCWVWLFREFGVASFILVHARRLYVAVVVIVGFAVLVSFRNVLLARRGIRWEVDLPLTLYAILALFVVPLLGGSLYRRRARRLHSKSDYGGKRIWISTTGALVAVMVIMTLAASSVAHLPPGELADLLPAGPTYLVDGVIVTVVGACILGLCCSLPRAVRSEANNQTIGRRLARKVPPVAQTAKGLVDGKQNGHDQDNGGR